MSQGTIRPSALSLFGAYFFLFAFFMWPVVDLFSNTWPLQLGNIQWRVGFMGILTAYLHTPLLSLVLAMTLAYALRQKITLRVLSVLCVVGCVLLLAAMALFALDAVQLRSGVPQENRGSFNAGAIFSELKFFTALVVLVFFGWGGWRTAGKFPGKSKEESSSKRTAEVLKAQKRGA